MLEKGKMLNNLLVLVTNAHANQYDKAGQPYVLHVLKVMHYIKSEDEELLCIALAHDVVEDTKVTYQDLRNAGATERVIQGVKNVTKVPGETYEEHQERVMSSLDSIIVKMADLRHNSDIRRLKGVTEKDIKRIEKYQKFFVMLSVKRHQLEEK